MYVNILLKKSHNAIMNLANRAVILVSPQLLSNYGIVLLSFIASLTAHKGIITKPNQCSCL